MIPDSSSYMYVYNTLSKLLPFHQHMMHMECVSRICDMLVVSCTGHASGAILASIQRITLWY